MNWKKMLSLAIVAFLLAGCYGKFTLTRKLYKWNGTLGNKYINSIVMFVILAPVYGSAGFADFVFLNVVEFWTGTNPMAIKDGEVEQQMVEYNGKTYQITATKNRLDITNISDTHESKNKCLVFNPATNTWWVENGSISTMVARVLNETTMELIGPNGELTYINTRTGELIPWEVVVN